MQAPMPFPRMPSYMTEFQFSPVIIWKTVTADHRSVSKLLRGTCPESRTRLERLEMSPVFNQLLSLRYEPVTLRTVPCQKSNLLNGVGYPSTSKRIVLPKN
jgi:hypothetical protein